MRVRVSGVTRARARARACAKICVWVCILTRVRECLGVRVCACARVRQWARRYGRTSLFGPGTAAHALGPPSSTATFTAHSSTLRCFATATRPPLASRTSIGTPAAISISVATTGPIGTQGPRRGKLRQRMPSQKTGPMRSNMPARRTPNQVKSGGEHGREAALHHHSLPNTMHPRAGSVETFFVTTKRRRRPQSSFE